MLGDTSVLLNILAVRCRHALEAMTSAQRGLRFQDFPRGSCGDVGELVGRLVVETIGKAGRFVSGTCHPDLPPQQSHAWFELEGTIVDLTYDQFQDTGLSGWVFDHSPWHAKFEVEKLPLCLDPSCWMEYPHSAYAAMREAVIHGEV